MSRRQMKKMKLITVLCQLLLLYFIPSTAPNLITANMFEARGQRVCRVGKGKPCYKLAYFSEPRRRLNFGEAEIACRRDGGELLSVESLAEQKIIEQLITELRPSDGDFWIGLHRNHGDQDSLETDCSSQYYWVDGSKSTFRNWHWDEPSCGYEVCVVMYHQPSAPPGLGGLYMFQWNDDNCETKNNFICKYTSEKTLDPSPSPNSTQTDALPTAILPWKPADHEKNRTTALNLIYIILPTIPLLLLFLTVTGVCCYKLLVRRRKKQQKSEVCQTELGLCPSPTSTDVYNVIRLQKEDDLMATRPHTKNSSFLSQVSSPEVSSPTTGDYDNLGGRDTESGFVTLASTESGFLNFDLNDLSLGRRGIREFCDTSSTHTGKKDLYDTSLTRPGKKDAYDTSLTRPGKKDAYDTSLTRTGKKDAYDTSLTRTGKKDAYDTSLTRTGKDAYDSSLTRTGKAAYDTSLANTGKDLYDTSLARPGKRDSYDTSLTRTGKGDSYETSLSRAGSLTRAGKRDSYDTSLTRTGKRDSYDTSMTYSGKRDSYDKSLTRSAKRDSYDPSLSRMGKRDLYDTSLSRSANREMYDRSLGRRTAKSEHFGSGSYGEQEMYEGSLGGRGEFYDHGLAPGGHTVKADIYQTYLSNGKEDTYQTSLGYYGNRKSYQPNMDCYRNELVLGSGRRYFNEAEWVNNNNY